MADNSNNILETIAQAVARIEGRLDELDRKQHERFTDLEARLGHIERRLGRVEDNLAELTERLEKEQEFTSDVRDEYEKRLAALEKK